MRGEVTRGYRVRGFGMAASMHAGGASDPAPSRRSSRLTTASGPLLARRACIFARGRGSAVHYDIAAPRGERRLILIQGGHEG